MKKIILTSILFAFILSAYSQSKQDYYVVVKQNKTIEPLTKTVNSNNTLSLTFADSNLENFFNSKIIYKYKKAFPTAITPQLQRTYLVTLQESSSVEDLLNFDEIESIGLINDEGGVLYEPNDYSEGNGEPNIALELVHASEAFDLVQGNNPNIIIGIVDTKFEDTHDELISKIIEIKLRLLQLTQLPEPSSLGGFLYRLLA